MSVHFAEILPVQSGPRGSQRVVVIGNYPPRRCGIATFTADMVHSLRTAAPDLAIDVWAMARPGDLPALDSTQTVEESDRQSHVDAGLAIEASAPDLVWVQHEFGIFGGPAGEWLIDLLAPIAAPLVVTLHTVLAEPDEAQDRVLAWLAAHASRLVVMSRNAERILIARGDVDPEQVVVIEHGAPDRPFGNAAAMKARLGMPKGPMLLTFGLISPGKGIETAIKALARVVPHHPEVYYLVAGATHPNLLARDGEAYREGLVRLAEELGVANHIVWHNDYLSTPDLIDVIEAADIYLTPYTGPAQATSGTLSYAVTLGKAVISTPYSHAAELLGGGNGLLTPFGDEAAMGQAIADLLAEPEQLSRLQQRAYARGRTMAWPNFARQTLAVISALTPTTSPVQRPPSRLGQDDLERLCDDTGMAQHSVLGVPDRSHGYCIDDNARALILANLTPGMFAARATTFAAFIQHGWNPAERRFRNFMGYDRVWREAAGSDDSCGRTLWAIGITAARGSSADLRAWAQDLWRESADMALEFGSPRALAFAVLGADSLLESHPEDRQAHAIIECGADKLAAALRSYAEPGWFWFEPYLAYDNARLPQAMLAATRRLEAYTLAEDALAALDWLCRRQTAPAGHHRPIGTEAFGRSDRAWLPYDQQPVDAWATVEAAALAFHHTGLPKWRRIAEQAYAWFFGANDRGLALASATGGACQDGLTPRGVNGNRGAESVLALHLAAHALAELQAAGRDWPRANAVPPGAAVLPA